ncbi:MAG: helix-turn-helix domain-containing protein [Nocardioides sp.]|uniref:helix-turn-helix domain-containing protein n=1 Tax=Nocardioides sp. TaxID=35761 RepID=UPI0039E2BFD5
MPSEPTRPHPPSGAADRTAHDGTSLGATIRRRRKARGLTLVELAAAADLSHPFLSQLERGLASPSMASLHRIAQALHTTQPALMAEAEGRQPPAEVSLVRSGGGAPVANPGGTARTLVAGNHALYPMLFVGAPVEWGDWYTHAGEEFIHVIAGAIIVEIEDKGVFELGAGDTLYYPGGVAHRWRGVRGYGAETARLLFVQENRPS